MGMPPEFVDTHCHLDMVRAVEAVLSRARAAGVRQCISVGTTLESSRANVALADQYPMLRAAVGVHPHEADTVTDDTLTQIDALADHAAVAAIGEVGLDHYRQHATPENQLRALRGFVGLAQRRNLPLIIHCRDAYEPLLELLQHAASRPIRGVLHCASGPPEFIRAALEFGLHVSFAGNVTFPNAGALRDLVRIVPDDRLLMETDAPFLAPQPVRGAANEPAFMTHTAACLAQVRGTTVESMGAITSRNARHLFALPEATSIETAR